MEKKLITEIKRYKELMNINESFESKDISGLSKLKAGKLKNNKYFIVHHTGDRNTASDVVSVLNNRIIKGKKTILGVQWVIDRKGNIFQTLPIGAKGAHVKSADLPGVPKDIGNSTAQGVEIVGLDDNDILPIQCLAALKLVKGLGYKPNQIYGHGEVNSHKQRTEGKTCKAFIIKNYNKDLDELESQIKLGNKDNTKNQVIGKETIAKTSKESPKVEKSKTSIVNKDSTEKNTEFDLPNSKTEKIDTNTIAGSRKDLAQKISDISKEFADFKTFDLSKEISKLAKGFKV